MTTAWLESNLQNPAVRIIDCRWILGQPGVGRRQYKEGHIPGAVHLDVDEHLSAKEGPGRHPLPSKRDFQKVISGVGIRRETQVVVYDEGKGAPAARLWWLLRYYGHENVSILDGGWSLWVQDGKTIETEIKTYPAMPFAARPKRRWVVDKEAIDAVRDEADVLLLDARAPERYRGEVEPIDARAGHIPGAKNFPFVETLDPATGKFLAPEVLKGKFRELGTNEAVTIICYCGSGVTACTDIFALHLIGIEAKLYEGSWSDWSRDSELPAQK